MSKAPRGEAVKSAKLTEAQVRDIRKRLACRVKPKVLAEEYGISLATISSIAHGRYWKHVI